jgi:hypothetical protein
MLPAQSGKSPAGLGSKAHQEWGDGAAGLWGTEENGKCGSYADFLGMGATLWFGMRLTIGGECMLHRMECLAAVWRSDHGKQSQSGRGFKFEISSVKREGQGRQLPLSACAGPVWFRARVYRFAGTGGESAMRRCRERGCCAKQSQTWEDWGIQARAAMVGGLSAGK